MHILGSVRNKIAVIVDDIVATAGSLVEAAESLRKKGALEVYAAISHGVLSGNALQRIQNCSVLKEVVITDSIPFRKTKSNPKITTVTIAPLLADAIYRIHNEASISCLFE